MDIYYASYNDYLSLPADSWDNAKQASYAHTQQIVIHITKTWDTFSSLTNMNRFGRF